MYYTEDSLRAQLKALAAQFGTDALAEALEAVDSPRLPNVPPERYEALAMAIQRIRGSQDLPSANTPGEVPLLRLTLGREGALVCSHCRQQFTHLTRAFCVLDHEDTAWGVWRCEYCGPLGELVTRDHAGRVRLVLEEPRTFLPAEGQHAYSRGLLLLAHRLPMPNGDEDAMHMQQFREALGEVRCELGVQRHSIAHDAALAVARYLHRTGFIWQQGTLDDKGKNEGWEPAGELTALSCVRLTVAGFRYAQAHAHRYGIHHGRALV